MKCRDIKLWLLSTRDRDPLPSTIQRHLEKCARCRSNRRKLKRLDDRVRQMPTPAASSNAKANFLRLLQETPGPVASETRPQQVEKSPLVRLRDNSLFRWSVGIVAASLLLCVGWLLGRGSTSPVPEMANMKPVRKAAEKIEPIPVRSEKIDADQPGHLAILVRVMKHNNQLAEAYDLDEQIRIFESMSDDLKSELIRLVQRGSLEDGKAIADLYGMVVRDGLLPRAVRLPADKKEAAAQHLAVHFQKTVTEIDAQVRQGQSPAKDVLASLKSTASYAADQLEGKGSTEVVRSSDPTQVGTRPLLQTLVVRGLMLASEPDPLNRADLCSDIAARVAPSVILLSAGAGADKADMVGNALNELLERGVAGNLEKVERERGKDVPREEAAKVRERTTKAWNALEAGLVDAPGDHQDDVKRMIGASAPGRDRVAFPGKGKGLKRNDEKFTPPGFQKKNQKQSSLGPLETPSGRPRLGLLSRRPCVEITLHSDRSAFAIGYF